MNKRRKIKTSGIIILVLLTVIVGLSIFFVYKYLTKDDNVPTIEKEEIKEDVEVEEPIIEEKKLTIIDEDSNSRNIAVMYNNISTVWGYQSGLQDAYVVYEIIVEGGYTRLMAIFKDKDTNRIGSVRSSRPYFLDYAMENDAIYVHFGASTQASNDIKSLRINNINGMYDNAFWRDRSLGLATEHTAFTSMEKINKYIKNKSYRATTEESPVLNYSTDEIDLSSMEGAISANEVFIEYSASRTTSYKYDLESKLYLRIQGTSRKDYPHTDYVTKEQYTTKNIIVYQVKNYRLDSKDRQALENIGSGDGYFITNGYAVPITWEKNSRSSKTIYKYLNGEEIKVNDGNTYIQIQPLNKRLNIG